MKTANALRGKRARVLATTALTALCTVYVLSKIDVRRTITTLAHAQISYFAAAIGITVAATVPMAWRWQRLLRARDVNERLPWLIRTYFVSYSVGQVLPTSLGGDAARIYSTLRRHAGQGATVTGSVLLERALGGAATLALAGVGFVLAIGHYDVGPYLWLEAGIAVVTVVLAIALFSRRARRLLRPLSPMLQKLRIERPLRITYEGIHGYRDHALLVVGAFVLTIVVQAFRVAAIWLIGKSVGVELSPRPYYVMGPILFLVAIVPFTINGIALREAFFVSFLGKLNVNPDAAFATGFLFFLTSLLVALPGAAILAVESAQAARGHISRRSTASSEPEKR